MNINNRICTQIGHEKFYATHMCIFKDCNQELKWCCIQCITQGIHNHNLKDQTHLIPWHDIIIQKKEESILYADRKQYRGDCNNVNRYINLFNNINNSLIHKYKKSQRINIKSIISDLSQETFIQLDDQRICELIHFNKNQYVKYPTSLIMPLENIDKNIIQLENSIKEYQEFWKNSTSTYDYKTIKYQVEQIDQTDSIFNASQISADQRYLVYGAADSILKIYSIKLEQIIQEIKVDQNIHTCQFTSDSSQLFVGMSKGYVCGYDVLNNQKLIFKQQIHQDQVSNIRTIQNKSLITCSSDRTIIKTDIKIHTEFIVAIDYDDLNEIIVSGSDDKSIKLWDCKNKQIIINKLQSHSKSIRQIQLIDNNQNILSLDLSNNLYKWKIDLKKQDLIKIQEYRDPNKIFNFYLINQNLNLLLICEQYIKILDEQGETINVIYHQEGELNRWITECRQLDNCRYIHIRSKQRLLLAKALN